MLITTVDCVRGEWQVVLENEGRELLRIPFDEAEGMALTILSLIEDTRSE